MIPPSERESTPSRRQQSRALSMHRLAHRSHLRIPAEAERGSLAQRWAWELVRVLLHPFSLCAACWVAVLGNGLAHSLGLSPGRQAEVDVLSASTLALGSSLVAALRGDPGVSGLP